MKYSFFFFSWFSSYLFSYSFSRLLSLASSSYHSLSCSLVPDPISFLPFFPSHQLYLFFGDSQISSSNLQLPDELQTSVSIHASLNYITLIHFLPIQNCSLPVFSILVNSTTVYSLQNERLLSFSTSTALSNPRISLM